MEFRCIGSGRNADAPEIISSTFQYGDIYGRVHVNVAAFRNPDALIRAYNDQLEKMMNQMIGANKGVTA